ncbi:hypothetical protein TARUN_10167 [Trichoderma arundinaceum]|uniref:Uncharacterized protein n=1 Tax=Trichoderma arundinaceum TaxID=490622 RepID=A0A395N7J0_TRIAR|nr:hypothetical protein TARUN_10167 [Trichoderma arundinaceum]
MVLTVSPLRIKNGPHRVTKLAPGNRIPIDLDNKSSAPDTTAADTKRPPTIHLRFSIAAALIPLPPARTRIFIHGGQRRKNRVDNASRETDLAAGRADAAAGPRRGGQPQCFYGGAFPHAP